MPLAAERITYTQYICVHALCVCVNIYGVVLENKTFVRSIVRILRDSTVRSTLRYYYYYWTYAAPGKSKVSTYVCIFNRQSYIFTLWGFLRFVPAHVRKKSRPSLSIPDERTCFRPAYSSNTISAGTLSHVITPG